MRIRVIRQVCLAVAMSGLLAGCSGDGDMEQVEPQNVSMTNSPKLPGFPPGANTAAATEKFCYWNDKKYSDGASVCDNRIRYKCWSEKWVEVGQCRG